MASVARVMVDVLPEDALLNDAGPDGHGALACLDAAEVSDPVASIRTELQHRLGPDRFDLWFDRKTEMTFSGGTLRVLACNDFAANWIRSKFLADVQASAEHALGRDVRVDVIVGREAARPANDSAPRAEAGPAAGAARMIAAAPVSAAPLNPQFTLEEFVVGPSNQLAHHAALEVSSAPGRQYNPLFIHGHCGLGKTHLLQGICHRFTRLHPGRKWLYITAEAFTNEFLESLRARKTEAFRRRMRTAELLVIDDVHFLANKKATQEEFLHTFNQIDAGGRQIVLASDCPPKEITTLIESLTSRFVSGMVLRIDSPDLPTRLEILRRRAARHHWRISDAVLMHIARSAAPSIREMEGLLLRAVAGMALLPPADATGPANLLTELSAECSLARAPLPVERIVAAVAQHFGLAPAALAGASREKAVSTARSLAMYLARRHTGMSYPELGRAFGNKNHSTVIAACQRVEALRTSATLICWQIQGEVHHQTATDILHELESALRRSR